MVWVATGPFGRGWEIESTAMQRVASQKRSGKHGFVDVPPQTILWQGALNDEAQAAPAYEALNSSRSSLERLPPYNGDHTVCEIRQ